MMMMMIFSLVFFLWFLFFGNETKSNAKRTGQIGFVGMIGNGGFVMNNDSSDEGGVCCEWIVQSR